MSTASEHDDRAQRGAALLIATMGAEARIGATDLDRLDMDDAACCVLGQRFGWYDHGLDFLNLEDRESEAAHGFLITSREAAEADPGWDVAHQTDSWRRIVLAHRNEIATELTGMGWLLTRDARAMVSPSTGREWQIGNEFSL